VLARLMPKACVGAPTTSRSSSAEISSGQAHLRHLDLDVLAETGRHGLRDLLGVAEHRLVHHECLHRPSSERSVAVW